MTFLKQNSSIIIRGPAFNLAADGNRRGGTPPVSLVVGIAAAAIWSAITFFAGTGRITFSDELNSFFHDV
jgi:hypothetical protein